MEARTSLTSSDRCDRRELSANLATLVSWVRPGSTVLELGASTGYMSRALRAAGASVTAVEYDQTALSVLASRADEAHFGDLERPETLAYLNGRTFDVIVLADVLEHLVDPTAVLARCATWLAEGGVVQVCMPNVAYWRVRLALARGEWETTKAGIMDETHLCWFTRATAERMFRVAGFEVLRFDPVWFEMPLDNRTRALAPGLMNSKERLNEVLRRRSPEAFAAQFMWELAACA